MAAAGPPGAPRACPCAARRRVRIVGSLHRKNGAPVVHAKHRAQAGRVTIDVTSVESGRRLRADRHASSRSTATAHCATRRAAGHLRSWFENPSEADGANAANRRPVRGGAPAQPGAIAQLLWDVINGYHRAGAGRRSRQAGRRSRVAPAFSPAVAVEAEEMAMRSRVRRAPRPRRTGVFAAFNNLGVVQLRRGAMVTGVCFCHGAATADPSESDITQPGYACGKSAAPPGVSAAEAVRRNPPGGSIVLGALALIGQRRSPARRNMVVSSTLGRWAVGGRQVPKGLERVRRDVELPHAADGVAGSGRRGQQGWRFYLDRSRLTNRRTSREALPTQSRAVSIAVSGRRASSPGECARSGRAREAVDALKIVWSNESARRTSSSDRRTCSCTMPPPREAEQRSRSSPSGWAIAEPWR